MILASDLPSAWSLALPTAAAYWLTGWLGPRLPRGQRLLWVPLALHGLGLFYFLWAPWDGGVLHFGFAPALSVTAWLLLMLYLLEQHWFPQLRTRWAWTSLGALAVLLAAIFPGTALHTDTSLWLPLHWALGLSAYGLFAAALGHAWLMQRAEANIRKAVDNPVGLPLLTLERLTFRFVYAGFVLLSATLLAGLFFGEAIYGSAWQWNHKSVFSVLAWVSFASLLWGRRHFGWRGRVAVRVLYLGCGLLLLAYAGSRFVLEVVLGRSV
jgi:ABC-type uncharacterized transport system permease subunit